MAAQAAAQAICTDQVRRSITNGDLHQSSSALSTILYRLRWNILWTQHDAGLLHELVILPDNIAYPGIVDLPQGADLLDRLREGGRIAAHVAYHDQDIRLVKRRNNRRGLAVCQAHRLLNQHMLAMLDSGQGSIGMVFVAVQNEYRVQIFLPGQILIIKIAAFSRNVIALSKHTEQFPRNIADRSNLKCVGIAL